jgi:hypothetical protein
MMSPDSAVPTTPSLAETPSGRSARAAQRRSLVLLVIGALLGITLAGYGLFTAKRSRALAIPPEVLALVNDRPILRSDYVTQVETQFATRFERSTEAQQHQVFEDMLAEELTVQRGLELDLPSFDPAVRSALVAGVELEISADVLAREPSDAELREYYTAHRDRYMSDGVMRLRELVTHDPNSLRREADARDAVAALRSGATPLEVMQRYQLADSMNLLEGGHVDLGDVFEFAAREKLDSKVFAAASRLLAGQVSDPISLPDGWHIVVMFARIPPAQQSYESAADAVWADLRKEELQRVRDANISYLRAKADIRLSAEARALLRQ